MTTETRNEAAERLISHIHTLGQGEYGWLALGDGWSALDAGKDLAEALAAERRATVERIKDRILNVAPHDACDGFHQFCDPEAMPPGPVVWAMLDEEAAR